MRAALSSPASGLLTQLAIANASSAATSMATIAIVPRMTHSSMMSWFSGAADLASSTVPTSGARAAPFSNTAMAATTCEFEDSMVGLIGSFSLFAVWAA